MMIRGGFMVGPISTRKTRTASDSRSVKKANSSRSTVGTSTVRSRYLLPRSQEVSGAKRQAWHDAPWSDVPSLPGWCSAAERVAGTEPHAVHRLIQMPLQDGRLPERDQSAQRALAVGCRRVDQDARHLGAVRAGIAGVDPLPEGCRRVAALQRKLPDQGVGERMQQDVPQVRG